MTQWTADELGELLVDTFASREPLADPAAARIIAGGVTASQVRRRKWPAVTAAAAGVCAVVATSTLVLGRGENDPGHPSVTATTPPSHPASYAANRAAAEKESARVVGLVSLPDGATRLPGRPERWPRLQGVELGPSDRSLTRTSWWSVPVDADALQQYLLHHHPQGMSRRDGVGGAGGGIRDITYSEPSPQPAAFIGVNLLVEWKQVGSHSLVRADTFTAARAVRSRQSYVTGTVTAIDIDRVLAGLPGRQAGGPVPSVHLREPGDHQTIAALVAAANRLRASIKPPFIASCPYPGNPRPSITITFQSTTGTLRMHLEEDCWSQIEVRRDGQPIKPTLESGRLITLAEQLTEPPAR